MVDCYIHTIYSNSPYNITVICHHICHHIFPNLFDCFLIYWMPTSFLPKCLVHCIANQTVFFTSTTKAYYQSMIADLLYCDTCKPRTMSFIDSPWRQLPSCICSHTLIVVYAIPRWLIVIFAATSWHCRDERMVVVVEFFPMRRRTSTASSISFATITTDVSMVECRVLPIVLSSSVFTVPTPVIL